MTGRKGRTTWSAAGGMRGLRCDATRARDGAAPPWWRRRRRNKKKSALESGVIRVHEYLSGRHRQESAVHIGWHLSRSARLLRRVPRLQASLYIHSKFSALRLVTCSTTPSTPGPAAAPPWQAGLRTTEPWQSPSEEVDGPQSRRPPASPERPP